MTDPSGMLVVFATPEWTPAGGYGRIDAVASYELLRKNKKEPPDDAKEIWIASSLDKGRSWNVLKKFKPPVLARLREWWRDC